MCTWGIVYCMLQSSIVKASIYHASTWSPLASRAITPPPLVSHSRMDVRFVGDDAARGGWGRQLGGAVVANHGAGASVVPRVSADAALGAASVEPSVSHL